MLAAYTTGAASAAAVLIDLQLRDIDLQLPDADVDIGMHV
jgi:hypothetical protein